MAQVDRGPSYILTQAARSVLRPLGLIQKGRSRTWLDDCDWWVVVVEFQPSGWSKGSYLNVGCHWLWGSSDFLSFDEGYRVDSFHEYRDESSFALTARSLVDRAAMEVRKYRELFPTPNAVATFYGRQQPTAFWGQFHAAVACGLSGKAGSARRFFGGMRANRGPPHDWVLAAQADAAALEELLNDEDAFRQKIAERILRTRQRLKLPPVETLSLA